MTNLGLPETIWNSVVPICNEQGAVIGTGVVIAPRQVLTALHVVAREPEPRVTGQLAITAIVSLRPWQFGRARHLARRSCQRTQVLSGEDDRAVDLALLAAPDLHAPSLQVRPIAVRAAELVTILGYPGGRRTASHGPITSTDDADFVAHVSLGPGVSGAPAIDRHGRLAGLITMDHTTAGAIAIGPALLAAFLGRATHLFRDRDINPRHGIETCSKPSGGVAQLSYIT